MAELAGAVNPLFLRQEALQRGLDLFALAEVELAEACDAALAREALGRAHYRTLAFVAARPGLTKGELLRLLGVTKQALARTVAELGRRDLVREAAGRQDRRRRELRPTDAGSAVVERVAAAQRQRLAQAYRRADAAAVDGFCHVLDGLIADPARQRFLAEAGHKDGQG